MPALVERIGGDWPSGASSARRAIAPIVRWRIKYSGASVVDGDVDKRGSDSLKGDDES